MRIFDQLVGFVLLGLLAGCNLGEIGGDPVTQHADGGVVTHSKELCDGFDNDGNGVVDEGCTCAAGATAECYPGPKQQAGVGQCQKGTHTCEGNSEFGEWGACVGAVLTQPEICGNGIDEDCDGEDLPCGKPAAQPDAGAPACAEGATQPCYSGPAGTAGKGPCKQGTQTCTGGHWGACAGEVVPRPEVCNNWQDEDCDGKDQLCAGTTSVPLAINGDCVTVSCPPNAPYPVGCNIIFQGGDPRGCVASSPGSAVIYLQEGDACSAGSLMGTLLCSSVKGAGLNAVSCPINKPEPLYPTSKSGCPPTFF